MKQNTDEPAINIAHERFIELMIATNDRILAYRDAYPSCTDDFSAYRSATRLLALPAIHQRIKQGMMKAEEEAIALRRQFYSNRIADTVEKRELLACIMRKELTGEKEVLNKEGQSVKLRETKLKEVLKAIEMDNQMEDELLKKGSKYLQ